MMNNSMLKADYRSTHLRYRVLNSIPAHQYAFNALLSLLDLVVTTDIETAAVRCGPTPCLLVNPDYTDKWCKSDEELFMLIMHELHHILLGHTRLFPRVTRVHNFAFDAIINAYLMNLFPSPAHQSLFTSYYPSDRSPYFLLRPPEGWPEAPRWLTRSRAVPENLCVLHRQIYSKAGVTYEEIFRALLESAELAVLCDEGGIPLLGDHSTSDDEDAWGTTGQADRRLLVDAIRRIVESWPPPEEHCRGRSLHDQVVNRLIPLAPKPPSALSIIRQAMQMSAMGNSGRLPHGGAMRRPALISSPLPDLHDRRATVLRSLGSSPLYYEHESQGRPRKQGGQVHLYLDVSGSVDAIVPTLYAAIKPLSEYLYPKLHLFSTLIRDISLAELHKGVCLSDGGTDIAPVINHIIDHNVSRALLVTDGYVGKVSEGDGALLAKRNVRLVAVLTPGGWKQDLQPVTSRFFCLREASNG
jgi:hypothetical protein